ncbi:toluene tolerance protein [Methylobacillus rhizosphaerae]|nr:toluene tolerance protein [Methylobacillus rhizosphaerae]
MLIPRLKIRASYLLTPEHLEQISQNANILEQDERGIKVMKLENGNILKIFRVRHIFTLARIYSYARQFCKNADKLKKLGIPSVDIVQLFHFEDNTNTAVLYQPLPGETLNQLSRSGRLDNALIKAFGQFVAHLHQQRIYFRSLHFGNVVRTPSGQLGLIDIADLKIYPYSLTTWHRARNFKHLQRYDEDWMVLSEADRRTFADSYFAVAALPAETKAMLRSKLAFLSGG